MIFCPRCQTDLSHQQQGEIVIRDEDYAPQLPPPELSHQDLFLQSAYESRRTAFQLFFSWWQPHLAAIERFFVSLWPTSLFTFTAEERRALRLAARGTYKFSEIKDSRIAKWLTRRGGSSAVSGLETIRPEIAKHLVKTPESLRLNGIQFIDGCVN